MSEYFSLAQNCKMTLFPQSCGGFSSGDADLDDFFANDAAAFARQLFGKSYCFVNKNAPNAAEISAREDSGR